MANTPNLPTQEAVDAAVAEALHALGWYQFPADSPLKDELADRIANALPGRVHRVIWDR